VLEKAGHDVVVIDPRKAKGVIASKRKTDKLDARNLARMGLTGWYTEVHRKSPEARAMRIFLKARYGLVQTALAQGARIRGLLRAHGIRLGQVVSGEKTLAELSRELEIQPAILRNWMRLVERGGAAAVAAGEDVVPASRARELEQQVKVLRQLPGWFQDYNESAPHSSLGFLSSKEFCGHQYTSLRF